MYSGFLNIHKPSGISSFDAVKIVLHELLNGLKPEKRVKIGHAGTLDPLANGVLVAAVNQATKLISCVQNQKKTYVATFRLGVESDSEDIETELRPVENAVIPTQEDIERVLPEFLGTILQRPPIYSAVHVDGKKAYKLARQGKEIELEPREIFIQSLKLIRYEYPTLVMEIHCGSGTYIRSLGRDIARRLGTGAVMSALTRTTVGVFHIEDALEIRPKDSLEPLNRPHCLEFLRPMSDAVAGMPQVVYTPHERKLLSHGIPVRVSSERLGGVQPPPPCATDVTTGTFPKFAVMAESGDLLAIVHLCPDGKLRSDVNLATP